MPKSFLVRRNSINTEEFECCYEDNEEIKACPAEKQSFHYEIPVHLANTCSSHDNRVSIQANGNISYKQRDSAGISSSQFIKHCSCIQCRMHQMTPAYPSYCSDLIALRQTLQKACISTSSLPECPKLEHTGPSIINEKIFEPESQLQGNQLPLPLVTSSIECTVEDEKLNGFMVTEKNSLETGCANMVDQMMKIKPNFQCDQCGKVFKTKYTLNIHCKMPSHTTSKPFVCPTCGKGFRLSSTLCRHKIIHTTQRPHCCHICTKSFNRSSTLKTHLRTHSNQKEFVCNQCGKGFHQKGNLRNHSLIHTGEKPYSCSVCHKSFNKLSNLKFHMHSHTDQKPYRCRFCKTPFCRRGELKHHISRYHRRQREEKTIE